MKRTIKKLKDFMIPPKIQAEKDKLKKINWKKKSLKSKN